MTRGPAGLLQSLLATCGESALRFRAAAEGVEDPTLKRLFQTYSAQRAGFAGELRQELASLGGERSEPSEVPGGLAPAPTPERLDVPGMLGGTNEATIIAERERGEQAAVAAYGKAVRRRLPGSVGATLERQYLQVKDAHEHVRSLDRALASPA